jgi:hypothetical protein
LKSDARLIAIWNQRTTPVLLRRGGKGEKIRVRLPYSDDNRAWLKNTRRHDPAWSKEHQCWEIPKSWFNDLVERALERYRAIYIIQPFREQEICAPACMNAKGHECQCSCMGANHGQGGDGSWFEVSEAFATRWGQRELACRLLRKKT